MLFTGSIIGVSVIFSLACIPHNQPDYIRYEYKCHLNCSRLSHRHDHREHWCFTCRQKTITHFACTYSGLGLWTLKCQIRWRLTMCWEVWKQLFLMTSSSKSWSKREKKKHQEKSEQQQFVTVQTVLASFFINIGTSDPILLEFSHQLQILCFYMTFLLFFCFF